MNNDLDRRFLLGGLAGAAGISALAAMAKGAGGGGPLAPPAGPVASTSKPLSEVEPRTAVNAANTPGDNNVRYRITQPGSYYLTGNLQATAQGLNGIEIAADNVTLDLCGFTVQGAAGTGDGIFANGPYNGICVYNGHVKGWGASGVTLYGGCRACRISKITASNNGGAGIYADIACIVSGCVASTNAIGIQVQNSCTLSDCSCDSNSTDGIRAATRNLIARNNCSDNGTGPTPGAGIRLTGGAGLGGNRVEENSSSGNGYGYRVENALNMLTRNTSLLNTTHWSVSNLNFILVLSAASPPAFTGSTGGAPFAAAGYDPNANFTLG
jgi:hypothetical protein